MTLRTWFRIAIGYLTVIAVQVGAWALLAPRSFYDDFPGFGRTWISVDGPYNEHLVRDVGALNLALAVLLIAAAVRLTKTLVIVAAGASLAWGVPHFVYHLFNTDRLATGDIVANLGGLALGAAIPVVLVVMARRHLDDQPATT